MENNCKDCFQVKALEERIKKCEKILDIKGDNFEERINALERRVDVSDEKFKQVFERLDTIISILERRDERLPNLVWGVAGTVTGSIICGVIMWLIQK